MQNDVQYVKTCGIDFSFLEALEKPHPETADNLVSPQMNVFLC